MRIVQLLENISKRVYNDLRQFSKIKPFIQRLFKNYSPSKWVVTGKLGTVDELYTFLETSNLIKPNTLILFIEPTYQATVAVRVQYLYNPADLQQGIDVKIMTTSEHSPMYVNSLEDIEPRELEHNIDDILFFSDEVPEPLSPYEDKVLLWVAESSVDLVSTRNKEKAKSLKEEEAINFLKLHHKTIWVDIRREFRKISPAIEKEFVSSINSKSPPLRDKNHRFTIVWHAMMNVFVRDVKNGSIPLQTSLDRLAALQYFTRIYIDQILDDFNLN